jgi:hypothetical protein
MDERGVSFRWKDYRASKGSKTSKTSKSGKGRTRHTTMTLSPEEFMRRFLLHVLPAGFHRIRHYGLLANAGRRENLARVRALLNAPALATAPAEHASPPPSFVCRCCGATMIVVETFLRGQPIRAPPWPGGSS